MKGRALRIVRFFAIPLAVACTVTSAHAQDRPPQERPAGTQQASGNGFRIQVTAASLRKLGVAIARDGIRPYPNSCDSAGNRRPRVSVSDAMLKRFKRHGFTLTSLCLALGSAAYFDPETGRALPRFRVTDAGNTEITLNFPDCFKNAAPLTDCRYRFSHWESYEIPASEAAANRSAARNNLVKLIDHARNTNASGVIWDQEQGDYARDDIIPGNTVYAWIIASPDLRYGVGYALHGGEGEDDGIEDVDIETYRTQASGEAIWSEE